ncbi:MAG: universal stress protein [Proteobacteria bacterium]|nr:universal stress protein [Pseudomonadota bacterium]
MKSVWAFNPFDKNKKLEQKGVALIRGISSNFEDVEAVFVASPDFLELSSAFNIPEKDRFTKYPKKLLDQALGRLKIKLNKSTVLVEDSISLTSSVKTLTNYLAKNKMDLVVVASRAKVGLSRFVLGSFAETLVHFSPVDLLIYNEQSTIAKKNPKNLLFAHDFSRSADKGLEKAIEYAKTWGSLLHVIHIPDPAFGFKFNGQSPEVEQYRKRVRQKLQGIENKVASEGVFGSVEIDSNWSPVSERILAGAKSVKADFLLVVAKTGKLASFFGGSITRKILRSSTVPVLVMKKI